MKTHPTETELALFAGGDCGTFSRFILNRHIKGCEECFAVVSEFTELRGKFSARANLRPEIPDAEWNRLASEMRANIHLGLEAGACVAARVPVRIWNPRLTAVFASLLFLVGAGLMLPVAPPVHVAEATGPVVESTGSGLELRTGDSSLTLLNHRGSVPEQTASAQGVIRSSYIDAGGVTINSVYLE
jgi:hypothetical protein